MIALTFALLPALAGHQLDLHVRARATYELALDAAGMSPWQWRFRQADDIIAGRVFGAEEFAFGDDGLHVRSEGRPFEIGLTLMRALDLRRFPLVHIAASADAAATVRVVLRTTLDAQEAVSSAISLGSTTATLDLRREDLPDRAAMLRLRFDLPAGKTLRLRDVSLELPPRAQPAPIRELPTGTVEQQLLALRRIHDESPSTIVLPRGSTASRAQLPAQDPSAHEPGFIVAGLFAVLLAVTRLRPPREARLRALTELVLVLAVPMWLIVGDHFTGRVDGAQAILILATTVYATTLAWPRHWHWNGTARAWMLAAAVVAVAVLVGFALHRASAGLRPIGSGHLVRYLGWALVQQYLICVVCLERWRVLTGSIAPAVYLSALCFALLHSPNSSLMLATFAGGLCWSALYVREHALLPLAFSHAASALILIALLPPEILLSAEVSARFFQ